MTTQVDRTVSGTWVVPAGVTTLGHLLKVGGGGSGGKSARGGGGGGGGNVVDDAAVAVVPGETLTITIGAGGAAPATALTAGNAGGTTSVVGSTSGTLGTSAVGGGGGGGVSNVAGGTGANGGGGSGGTSGNVQAGGTGTAGFNGGAGRSNSITNGRSGGGGGGETAVGGAAVSGEGAGAGGAGVNKSGTYGAVGGAAGSFGGGGGGGRTSTASGTIAAGGAGGGGAGGNGGNVSNGVAGTANTGGGGGGGGTTGTGGAGTDTPPGAGGSGFVSFRYDVDAPGVPTSVVATPDETDIELSWSAPVTGGPPDSYEVRIDGGAPTAATSPHDFTGLVAGTSYDLEVRAVNATGASGWVLVTSETTAPTEPGYYRVELVLGSHSWEISTRDEPAYGPLLPLSLGWEIADAVEFFPAQPSITTLGFAVQTSDASDLADVVKGTTVTMRMFVDADPDADPWQTFDGVVTQLDGETVPGVEDAETLDFRVTVYAGDDTARLADMFVGWTDDWPIEHIMERVERICTEAGITLGTVTFDGGVGWLAAREHGPAVSALEALRTAFKDSAEEYDSESPLVFWGRPTFWYDHAAGELNVYSFRRRVFPSGVGSTTTLDGGFVRSAGRWTKQPGPHAATWGIVDGATFGTPDGSIPFVRNTSLLEYFGDPPGSDLNYSSFEIDALGSALLADGSTALDGWSSRSLRYEASLDVDNLGVVAVGWASPLPFYGVVVHPVVITPIGPELELNGVDYVAGTLTAARMVIPPGGRFYYELRLRSELLPGTDLP